MGREHVPLVPVALCLIASVPMCLCTSVYPCCTVVFYLYNLYNLLVHADLTTVDNLRMQENSSFKFRS